MQSGCYKYVIQMVTALDTCSNWDNFIFVQTAHLAQIRLTCMYRIVVMHVYSYGNNTLFINILNFIATYYNNIYNKAVIPSLSI